MSMKTEMKKMPPKAEAPSSISPTRPKKAVSVMPTICSTSELSKMGKAMVKISRWENWREGEIWVIAMRIA